jgi:hypothetical protein
MARSAQYPQARNYFTLTLQTFKWDLTVTKRMLGLMQTSDILQDVQLKSEPHFNISNLFITCYITQLT